MEDGNQTRLSSNTDVFRKNTYSPTFEAENGFYNTHKHYGLAIFGDSAFASFRRFARFRNGFLRGWRVRRGRLLFRFVVLNVAGHCRRVHPEAHRSE
jgi:hypothetical protein